MVSKRSFFISIFLFLLISMIFILIFSPTKEEMAGIAVFSDSDVKGEVLFLSKRGGTEIKSVFTRLPPGKHGFHIHRAGDLRGEGCEAACDHWQKGRPQKHGGSPEDGGERHTGDLGNIEMPPGAIQFEKDYFLKGVRPDELWGRSLIVHADPDDLGKGDHPDSHTTGHSGKRIACVIIGRVGSPSCSKNTTKKQKIRSNIVL
jgi:superoxide dismutase, Cu-Zn family